MFNLIIKKWMITNTALIQATQEFLVLNLASLQKTLIAFTVYRTY